VQSKLDGRNMTMVLAPDKKAQAAWEAQKRKGPESDEPGETAQNGPPTTASAPTRTAAD
jgi:hypothetical protein